MGDENWDEEIKPGSGGFGAAPASTDAKTDFNNNDAKTFGFGSGGGDNGGFNKREGGGFGQRRGGFGGDRGGGFGDREGGRGGFRSGGFGGGNRDGDENGDNPRRGGFGGGDRGGRGGFRSGGGFGNRDGGDREGGGRGFGGGNRDENGERKPFGGGGAFKSGFGNRDGEDGGDKPRRGGFGGGDREGGGFGRREGGGGFGGGDREGGGFGRREGGGGGFGGGDREGGGFGRREGGGRGGFGGGDREGGSFGRREGGGGFGGGDREGGGFGRREGGGGFGGGDREGGGFGRREGGGRGGFGNRDDNGNGEERKGRGFGDREGGGFGRREGGGGGGFGRSDENGERRGGFGDREKGGQGEEGMRRETYMPTYDDSEEALFQHITVGVNFAKQNEIPATLSGEGKESIQPIESFKQAGLSDLLLTNIARCQYEVPTPVQKYSIPIILAKRDLMACAQTGSGKTAAYVLPIMTNILHDGIESSSFSEVQTPQALILSPTRELALQIYQECRKFSHGSIIKSSILYGGVNTKFQVDNLNRGCNILIATPGRLMDVLERGQISLQKVKYFVLDEADRMLDMGFEKDVRSILEKGKVNQKTDRVTLMFSATFPSEIQRLAQDFLNNYLFLAVGIVGGANTDVEQVVYKVGRFEKRDKVVSLINEIGNERIMIFLEHKKQADILAFYLLQNKYPSTSIHGDRQQSQREAALADFKSGKAKIIVCTSVAARGLDIDKVGYVINYDLPKSIDEYVHRIGRTGRCGNLGKSISFYDPESENDRTLTRSLVMTLRQANQTVPDWLNEIAEGSHGTTYLREVGGEDLRDQMGQITLDSKPAPAVSAGGEEEAWD